MWLLEAFTVQVVQLVANFFSVLCVVERLVYSWFIRAFMLRTAPCYPWKQYWWDRTIKLWAIKTKQSRVEHVGGNWKIWLIMINLLVTIGTLSPISHCFSTYWSYKHTDQCTFKFNTPALSSIVRQSACRRSRPCSIWQKEEMPEK